MFASTPGFLRFVTASSLLLMALGCGGGSDDLPTASMGANQDPTAAGDVDSSVDPVRVTADNVASQSPARPQAELYPVVLVETSLGNFKIRLDAAKSPRTVDNFLFNYVERGSYDGTIFHYVEDGYMIAGGGFDTQRNAIETRTAIYNESDNGLSNTAGTIAMAHHPDYADSATSQFFINLVDNLSLDFQQGEEGEIRGYCVFGHVIEGMDIVERIGQVAVQDHPDFPNCPVEDVVIVSVQRVK